MIFGSLSGLSVGLILQPLEIINSNIIIYPYKREDLRKANIIRLYSYLR
jgi:hypothetical protein